MCAEETKMYTLKCRLFATAALAVKNKKRLSVT